MGAFATLAAMRDALEYPHQKIDFAKLWTIPNLVGWSSGWRGTGNPPAGATPTTSVALDRTSTGAVPIAPITGGNDLRGWIRRGKVATNVTGAAHFATIVIADRLNHSGGLDGTLTTAQTTNLPTAALTRYTNGVGVMAALEIYTAVGSTQTTATVSYTDNDGNTGQTSPAFLFGGSGINGANRMVPIPLAAGDTGFRAIASVTLAASTLTAGDFGVVLYRPLMAISVTPWLNSSNHPVLEMGGLMPKIEPEACLFLMVFDGSTATCNTFAELHMSEV